jgi:hypothetical protein
VSSGFRSFKRCKVRDGFGEWFGFKVLVEENLLEGVKESKEKSVALGADFKKLALGVDSSAAIRYNYNYSDNSRKVFRRSNPS